MAESDTIDRNCSRALAREGCSSGDISLTPRLGSSSTADAIESTATTQQASGCDGSTIVIVAVVKPQKDGTRARCQPRRAAPTPSQRGSSSCTLSLTWTIDVCWHARQTSSPLGGSLMA